METPQSTVPRIPWRLAPLLTALYAGAIALLTWPWLATASTRVLDHWDPPFHAWKLMFAARTLLSGHILPPGGNTNLYYPNTGAFFYEALHWPQAVFAAPLLAAGASPVLTYHITLVFFWALSGALFWAWLRALGARPLGAVLGGLFFTVLPYRMSYAVEFNMQLVFGLPLFLLAMTRFFQRPGYRYALLAAVAWWLQATSELYQAVFLLFALPFLVLPLLARDPSLLRSGRRFWGPAAAAAALCAALSLPFLLPYAGTLGDGTLTRSLEEMRQHTLEPFSFLRPWGHLRLFNPKALGDEMNAYPTLALSLAALCALVAHRRPAASARQRIPARLLGAACALFAALSALSHWLPCAGDRLVAALSWSAFAAVLLTIPVLLRRNRDVARAAAVGLGAAALFGVVMSFGPDIRISATDAEAKNVLFDVLHALVPGLAGFRVVSRFVVFPVMALCAAAAFGVDAAADALRARPSALRAGMLALFLAVFLAECVSPKRLRTRPIRDTSRSAVLAALDAQTGPCVLAVVPMGLRDLDSEHMLTIERNDRLGIWAWGGTFPAWTRKVQASLENLKRASPECAAHLLREPWPETLVLEDRRPFPGIKPEDYAAWFGPLAETVAEDPNFRILKISPATEDEVEIVKLVRRDFALALPVARFTLSARNAPARVWLDLNGTPVGVWEVSDAVDVALGIPPELLTDHLPERFRFHAEGDRPFRLEAFRLEEGPAPSAGPAIPNPPDLPWLSTSRELPDGASPLDIRYPGGMVLCGAMLRSDALSPASSVPLRLFLRFPESARALPGLVLSPGFAQRGSVLFQHPTPLRSAADVAAFGAAHGRIVAADVNLPLPSLLRPGETYDLTLDVKTPADRRITGRDADGRKVRHAQLGIRWVRWSHAEPRRTRSLCPHVASATESLGVWEAGEGVWVERRTPGLRNSPERKQPRSRRALASVCRAIASLPARPLLSFAAWNA